VPQENGGVCWAFRPIEESIGKRIMELAETGMSKREIAEELAVNRSTVYRSLARQRSTG
jgi:IS30 family transposase